MADVPGTQATGTPEPGGQPGFGAGGGSGQQAGQQGGEAGQRVNVGGSGQGGQGSQGMQGAQGQHTQGTQGMQGTQGQGGQGQGGQGMQGQGGQGMQGQGGQGMQGQGTQGQGTQGQGTQGMQAMQGGQGMQPGGQGRGLQEQASRSLAAYGRNPFALMQQLTEEMDHLFESFFFGRPLNRMGRATELRSIWAPDVEVRDEGNQLHVSADLPGVPLENVSVEIHDNVLTIQGERREEHTQGSEQQGFRRSERRYGSFHRSIPLPEGADTEHAEARMREGVLEITIPIVGQKQARRLPVQLAQ